MDDEDKVPPFFDDLNLRANKIKNKEKMLRIQKNKHINGTRDCNREVNLKRYIIMYIIW